VFAYEERAFDALGDATRRAVLKRLRSGGRSVGEIAEGMDVSRPAVSQHLKILKEARLVTVHSEGTRRVYTVDRRGIESLRRWFDQFWEEALLAFKDAAEREAIKGASGRMGDVVERTTKGRRTRSLEK
jgi:DNA-binding transcriptional ArsR family regulator